MIAHRFFRTTPRSFHCCRRVIEVVAIGVLASTAQAQNDVAPEPALDTAPEPSLRFDINQVIEDANSQDETPVTDRPIPFGHQGARRFTLSTGAASDGTGGSDFQPIAVAFSSFVDDDVEVLAELGTWYFDQDGDQAAGLSMTVGARWHALNRPTWSLFVDAGIGVLAATDNVPEDGTSFDFLPRLGGGATFEIGNTGTRAIIGLRWHHISNARIFGDVSNPSRNAPMVYFGVSFPL